MSNHMITPTQRRAKEFGAAMGWRLDEEQIRVAFFVPERDELLAMSIDKLIPGWQAERLDDGRLVIWTYWLGRAGYDEMNAIDEYVADRTVQRAADREKVSR